jgi:hypothetical protein
VDILSGLFNTGTDAFRDANINNIDAQVIFGTATINAGTTPTLPPGTTTTSTSIATSTTALGSTTSTTTSTTSTTLEPLCGTSPEPDAGCRLADASGVGKSSLQIKNASDDTMDSLKWKWSKGEATDLGDFKTPTADGVTYRVCLYDSSTAGPLLEADIPNGGVVPSCAGKPCWKATGTSGFKYKNKAATSSGITDVKLKAGLAGKASVQVKGKGVLLRPPATAALSNVVVQLLITDGATTECFKTTFANAEIIQDDESFKVKGPSASTRSTTLIGATTTSSSTSTTTTLMPWSAARESSVAACRAAA